jgi:hypothetical protein
LVGAGRGNGTARRVRGKREVSDRVVEITTVACSSCADRFTISHDAQNADLHLAGLQAAWLQERLTWDHIQERKHRGLLDLPSADQLK